MKKIALSALLLAPALFAHSRQPADSLLLIPERAVIVSGDKNKAHDLLAVIYDTSDLHFSDPNAPRFLFFDREGKVALGIGGYLKGTAQYDFSGAIDDGSSFTTFDIPVPYSNALNSQFYANANHSTIFLQMAGRSSRFGYYQMYVQTNFSGGGPGGYGIKVKQAWGSIGNITVGLARSSFVDGSAGTPTIDDQGPAGEMTGKNVLVRYALSFGKGWRVAASIENPSVTLTAGTDRLVEKINPRVPDIPVNIQYSWPSGTRIRFSALLRNIAYRNLLRQRNSLTTGWAFQLSGNIAITPALTIFYQGAYGRGYGSYINDLKDNGFDLVYSPSTLGEMIAPKMANFEVGARFNVSPRLFFAASYSQARVFDLAYLGPSTFRYSQYISATAFFDIIPDLRIGAEYLHGTRTDFSSASGHANRLTALLQYSF